MAERIRTISEGDSEPDIRHYDLLSTSLHSEYSLMNTSQISTASTDSQHKGLAKTHSVSKGKVVSGFLLLCISKSLSKLHLIFRYQYHQLVVFQN